MPEEGLAEHFYKKLSDPLVNSGVVLEQFYSTATGLKFNGKNIPRLNKAVKIYGKELVFLSLLDIVEKDIDTKDDYLGLLFYFIKKRVEAKYKISEVQNLSKDIQAKLSEIEKLKREEIEVIDPFNGQSRTI